MNTSTVPALTAEGLTAGYDGTPVLHDVGLALRPGEVLGVIGPNGCGKSTLVRCLTGLLPLRGGRVEILGTPLDALSARERARRCAVLTQFERPAFDVSVLTFVLLGRHPHLGPLQTTGAEDHAVARRAMERTGIAALSDKGIRALSGGEWQRVLLARTLAQDTPVLLLDEPAAHLDPGHRYECHQLLREIASAEARAILCISHDINLAAGFSDRLLLLASGRVHALGPAADVLTEPLLQEAFASRILRVRPNPLDGRNHLFLSP